MNIVAADDEPSHLRLVMRIVTALGHSCAAVQSARALLELCARQRPDAVISDIGLGAEDGVAACLELRRLHPGLPIIMVTGDADHAARASRAGFERVLLKPYEPDTLRSLLLGLDPDRPADPV